VTCPVTCGVSCGVTREEGDGGLIGVEFQ